MKSENKSFIGIDVSKSWFDVSLMCHSRPDKKEMVTAQFNNDPTGLKLLTKWLASYKVPFNENTLVVIENTGLYHRLIWKYCCANNLSLHIGNAANIKWSLGIARGKDDTVDSKRLCDYCYRHADQLKATPSLNPIILQLKDLMTARTRLIKQINSTRVYLGELKLSNSKEVQKIIEQAHKAALDGLKKSLAVIEEQIKNLVQDNADIKENYDLLNSVPGVGHVTALYIIGCTANFAMKISGKQLACYAGVVPFPHKSGSSIKGRNRVHKMANKELKALLHMGARSIARKGEFKEYYDRKSLEGKHDLAIINAIKNKIVLRAVAVINNQRKYVDKFEKVA